MNHKHLAATLALLFCTTSSHAADPPPPKLPFTLSRETTAIISPLLPDGAPDYIAALNEKYGKGVTAENDAFVAWLSVSGTADITTPEFFINKMLAILNAPPPPPDTYWISYTDYLKSQGINDEKNLTQAAAEFDALATKFWKPEDQIRPAAFLESQKKLLTRAVAASSLKTWWAPVVPSDRRTVSSAYIAAQKSLRDVSRALCVRAMMNASAGDLDAAIADLLAVKRLASVVSLGPTILEGTTAATIDGVADRSLGLIVGTGQLTQVQCTRLREKLKSVPERRPMAESIDVHDRWSHLDRVLSIAVIDINVMRTGSNEKIFASLDRSAIDWNAILTDINAAYDRTVIAARSPQLDAIINADMERNDWQTIAADADPADHLKRLAAETPAHYTQRVGRYLLGTSYSYYREPVELERQSLLLDRMLTLLSAAAEQKARSGAWPADLSKLATPAELRDLYPVNAPGTLRYQADNNGASIESSGPESQPLRIGATP